MFDKMPSDGMCHACLALGNLLYNREYPNQTWKGFFDVESAILLYQDKYPDQILVHIQFMQAEQAQRQHAALQLMQNARKRKATEESHQQLIPGQRRAAEKRADAAERRAQT